MAEGVGTGKDMEFHPERGGKERRAVHSLSVSPPSAFAGFGVTKLKKGLSYVKEAPVGVGKADVRFPMVTTTGRSAPRPYVNNGEKR